MAYPQPTQVAPWYLRNITQALELDQATGNVFVRTNAAIAGNVSIGNVAIGSLGNVDLSHTYLPVSVTGNIAGITGNVTVNPITGNVGITGNANVVIQGTPGVSVVGNIAGITANVTVVDGGGSLTVDGNVNATITGGNVATTIGGTNLDAFGRLRVSNPVTLFDSQNLYVDGQQFSQALTGSATRTYVQNESSFNLTVGTGGTDSVTVQSKTTQAYQPGKSLLIMNTFAMASAAPNLVQRVGYFTTNNGIYFEQNGAGDLYIVIRSNTTGTPAEDRILQANWNGDTLTGTGGSSNPSNIDLDPTLTQIFWCDIEWLGVGNVRCGFVINGQFIVCHTFQHANIPGNTKVYMTTATLNPRYEIYKTGAGTGGTMKQICSTVISEGGYAPTPTIEYVGSGIQATRLSTGNVYTNLATIRLNPNCIDAVVTPSQVDLLLKDVQYGAFQLVVNASNAAGLTYANVGTGIVQANTSAVQIGDGTVVYSGVTSSRDTFTVGEDVARRLQLSRSVNGTPDTLTLCAGYGANNADLIWRFGWSEYTN